MRPIKLTIQAFGAYVQDKEGNPITIDFTKLGNKGLFLVTGDTGAGKTTIFDAITYALFDKTSGQTRDGAMMRSTYAPDNVKTFVELEFEYKGQTYVIKRSPAQPNPGKKTPLGAEASLQIGNDTPITRLRDVNDKIVEIIGLTFEQYSQIAMIAQGKFRELLLADTKKRSDIFRSIFETGKFLDLQAKLKTDVAALQKDVDLKRSSVVQYIDGAVCLDDKPEASILADAKQKVRNNQMTVADACAIISGILESDRQEKSRKDDEFNIVGEELKSVNSNLTTLRTYNDNIKALEEKRSEKNRLETDDKPGLELALNDAQSHQTEIEQLAAEIARMNLTMGDYQKLTKCTKEIQNKDKAFRNKAQELDTVSKAKDELGNQILEADKELSQSENPDSKIATITARQNAINAEKAQIGRIGNQYNNYLTEKSKLPGLFEKLQTANRTWEEKNNEYAHQHTLFIASQAGILAQELTEGTPCPVCGATHHPAPAALEQDALTKEQLDALQKHLERFKEAVDSASSNHGSQKVKVDTACNSLLENAKPVLGELTIDELPGAIESANSKLDSEFNQNKKELADLNKLSEHRQALEKILKDRPKLNDLTTKETNLKQETAGLDSEIKALIERETELKKGLEYETESKANEALTDKEKALKNLKDNIKTAEQNLQKYGKKIAEIDGSIKQLEELTKQAPTFDYETLNAKQASLIATQAALKPLIEKLAAAIATNQTAIENIGKASATLNDLEQELSWKSALSKTANGDLNGKERINLEVYVQMAYFDRILNRANIRLITMSSGQYELRRSSTYKGNGQAGLDLDVYDYYNNSTRSVKSLSGGESFMASLSLALGLSDEIQSTSGGIQIDTMFVDEGFGSLDEDTLEQALKALNQLTEGDRLIGIISHVAELRRIDKQIVVTKDRSNFSQVRIQI